MTVRRTTRTRVVHVPVRRPGRPTVRVPIKVTRTVTVRTR